MRYGFSIGRPVAESGYGFLLCMILGVASALLLAGKAGAVAFDADNLTDADIAEVAARLRTGDWGTEFDAQVTYLIGAQNTDSTSPLYGAFADVQPKDPQDIDFERGYFDPILTLAKAYVSKTSKHYRSEGVLDAIHKALIYNRNHVYPGCKMRGNWWVWGKQMPDCVMDIMSLILSDLAPEDRRYLLTVVDFLVPNAPLQGMGHHHGKSGKDAVNMLKIGVLTRDRTRITYAWEGMENAVAPYFLEPDGSPLIDNLREEWLGVSLPYMYEGYGTLVEWLSLTDGTPLAPRKETSAKIVRYLLDLGRWNTFQGTEVAWISLIHYRTFWRPASTLSFARSMSGFDVSHADELRAMADGTDVPPDGVRYWPSIETLIYRAPDFYCCLLMATKKQGISWAYKNKFLHIGNKWYYGRDGHTILASEPQDHHPDLTFTFNWRRLSGITRDDGSVLDSPQREGVTEGYFQPQHIVCMNPIAGAATLNEREAVAGIEVHSGELRARKSYYFLRDENMIVTLGDGIEGRGQTDTIVHTFPIGKDAAAELSVNGEVIALVEGRPQVVRTPAWVAGPRGGYYFPEDGAVTLLTETRKPDFEDDGGPTPEKEAAVPPQKFISIFFDHGKNPKDAQYASVYWHAAKPTDMPDLVKSFSENSAYCREKTGHSFRHGSYLGLTFFDPGTLQGHSADRPCFIVVHKEGQATQIGVYEPSWEDVSLTLGLPFNAGAASLPQGCTLDGATFQTGIKAGRPLTLAFRRKPGGDVVLESVTTPNWPPAAKQHVPRPRPRQDDFEETAVSDSPKNALSFCSGIPGTIVVTDETAARGRHSVKIIEGAPGLPFYEPELVYDLFFEEGTALLSYDVRLETGAVLRNDLRDKRSTGGVGPSLVFNDATLTVADQELLRVPEGEWFHVEVEVALGEKAAGTFDLAVTLPGQAAQRLTNLPCRQADFAEVFRCFFSAYGSEPGAFFLDNIRIELR